MQKSSKETTCYDDFHVKTDLVVHVFQSLDFGPSLMDEVFKALDKGNPEPSERDKELAEQQSNESNNLHNEIQEVLKNRDATKKKPSTVKPISASDQKTLVEAIAIANELATRSLADLDCRTEAELVPESPKTPSSPNKRKFSFKFSKSSSPKAERRNFSEEAESIVTIEETLTDDAKQAYTTLIEKTNTSSIYTVPINPRKFHPPEGLCHFV